VLEEQKNLSENPEMFSPAVLMFDEMSISQKIQFDRKEQRLYGPFKNVQVAMIRGLFEKWKQPIYYDFDTAMSKTVLFEILSQADDYGLQIVAMVSDMGPKNVQLWNSLGVSFEKPWFEHPIKKDKQIFVFADIPHVIKLMRNHLLDKGFILKSGATFLLSDLNAIIESDASEFRLAHKLQISHLVF
jgi:hypothetical protein